MPLRAEWLWDAAASLCLRRRRGRFGGRYGGDHVVISGTMSASSSSWITRSKKHFYSFDALEHLSRKQGRRGRIRHHDLRALAPARRRGEIDRPRRPSTCHVPLPASRPLALMERDGQIRFFGTDPHADVVYLSGAGPIGGARSKLSRYRSALNISVGRGVRRFGTSWRPRTGSRILARRVERVRNR